jgi:hypothetical protein
LGNQVMKVQGPRPKFQSSSELQGSIGCATRPLLKSNFRNGRWRRLAAPHRGALRTAGLRPAAIPHRMLPELFSEKQSKSAHSADTVTTWHYHHSQLPLPAAKLGERGCGASPAIAFLQAPPLPSPSPPLRGGEGVGGVGGSARLRPADTAPKSERCRIPALRRTMRYLFTLK